VADYSQIELRIAAYFAKDEEMLAAFQNREDLHRKTAAGIRRQSADEVSKADRQTAKAANFGFQYGQSAEGFQVYARTEFGIILSLGEATELSRFQPGIFVKRVVGQTLTVYRELWGAVPLKRTRRRSRCAGALSERRSSLG
jgi:hypothetical protein